MSIRPLRPNAASALLSAARAAVSELPPLGAASTRPVTSTPPAASRPTALPQSPPPHAGRATGRNAAQQNSTLRRTNPRRSSVTARQMMAARLLLLGRGVGEIAVALGVHPYTVTRWKRDPLFEAELRRQVERAAPRNTAQQNPTPAQNEANRA